MKDREVRSGGATRRFLRYRWLALALAVVGGVGLILGPEAFGNAPGPTLSVDQGFNSGQPAAPQWPADGPGGSSGGTLFASAIQPDGKVIVVGQNAAPGPIVKFDVARYNADGSLDTSFGTNGYVQVAPTASSFNFADAVALDPQTGDIVIAGGDIGTKDIPELVRLTPNGALDTSFGGGSGEVVDSADPGSWLTGVVVDSSSRIVTIGTDGVVRRYAANGSVDSSFGSGGHTGALVSSPAAGSNLLALQPADGRILVAGTFSGAGIVDRLNTDGTPDTTFGSGGTATLASGTAIRQMTLQGTNIVVGGNDGSGNGMVARLTSTGALDTTFGGGSGYDIFTPPSGSSTHVDGLFYAPRPGFIVCLYSFDPNTSTDNTVCFSIGLDGVPTGSSFTLGDSKDGGGYFLALADEQVWDELGYNGVFVFNATDTPSGGGGGPSCSSLAINQASTSVGTQGQGVTRKLNYPVTVNATASGGTLPYTWALTVNGAGQPVTTSGATATYSPAAGLPPGVYVITFTATDSSSPTQCSASRTLQLKVGNPSGTGPEPCRAKLEVEKHIGQYWGKHLLEQKKTKHLWTQQTDEVAYSYVVTITNVSKCPAKGVRLKDQLPSEFRAHSILYTDAGQKPFRVHNIASSGLLIHTLLGDLAPGETDIVQVWGVFTRDGITKNIAVGQAENASDTESKAVFIGVEPKAAFERDERDHQHFKPYGRSG